MGLPIVLVLPFRTGGIRPQFVSTGSFPGTGSIGSVTRNWSCFLAYSATVLCLRCADWHGRRLSTNSMGTHASRVFLLVLMGALAPTTQAFCSLAGCNSFLVDLAQ